jgi:DNA polymerase III gamma/tau subunit
VLEDLTIAILKSDVPKIINIISDMDQSGKDLQRVVMEMLESFRNLLVVLYAGKGASALELPETQLEFYNTLAPETEAGRVLRIIDALVETDGRMRFALSKKTLLETGLIRCSRAAETASINELLKQVAALKKNFKSGRAVGSGAAKPAASSGGEPQKKKIASDDEVNLLLEKWHDLIQEVGRANSLAKSYLLNTAPLRTDETHLVVGFDPEFSNDRKRLEDDRTKVALSRAVEKRIGRMLSISFEPLKSDDVRPLPSDSPVTDLGPDSTVILTKEQKWYANPVVKMVVDTFNGEISDIRE